ncbi:MAG: glycoside hydrolase family 3 C-terminal domain-containing protein [Clostridia bacterium]|nr:glycoside hydrolase family 3 C-terminal domain-containing protein [Clostridia bacterium]
MKYDSKNFTTDEKLRLLTGKNHWQTEDLDGKLPSVFLSDGPHGLRMVNKTNTAIIPATAMPTLSVLANSWDPALAYLQGETIADECIENGADVLLAPGVNIKRTPLCGRNFEYFSEDPFLAGVMAKAYIEGVQSKGVGTSLKHFCANNREYDRLYQTSDADERTLREIYLPAFETALGAKPWTVMCSYNPVNGIYASENKRLLKDILRDEFGFDGLIVSDWSAVHSGPRAAKATLDLRMPYTATAYDELKVAYENGWLKDGEIDACVQNLFNLIEKTENGKKKIATTKEQRHENAVKIAREGAVLLKNEDGVLPLKKGNILVTGVFGQSPALGGGGSAFVTTEHQSKPLCEELASRLKGANVYTCKNRISENDGGTHIKSAFIQAYGADVAVLCVGNGKDTESESFDRTTLRLSPRQEDLILGVAKANPNVVVVIEAGSAVDMSPWIDKVKAVLYLGFAGEGAQEALADLLTGKACPCGKLNETFPLSLADAPAGDKRGNGFYERYDEGIFVGYRWYDKEETPVLFPFGHGLSYAKFEYSAPVLTKISETDYEISYTVKNVSDADGAEISQVYVRDVFTMVPRPEKELKGFTKTFLKAGESKRVTVALNARAFAYYNVMLRKWHIENGEFEILIGASSRDIRLKEKLVISLPETEQYSME